jgi:hypothetical protein
LVFSQEPTPVGETMLAHHQDRIQTCHKHF